jgi:NAD(P)H dehydrogenase (quinone)
MTLDEIAGGVPYGATTIGGGVGSRLSTAIELQGACYQVRKKLLQDRLCTGL